MLDILTTFTLFFVTTVTLCWLTARSFARLEVNRKMENYVLCVRKFSFTMIKGNLMARGLKRTYFINGKSYSITDLLGF